MIVVMEMRGYDTSAGVRGYAARRALHGALRAARRSSSNQEAARRRCLCVMSVLVCRRGHGGWVGPRGSKSPLLDRLVLDSRPYH